MSTTEFIQANAVDGQLSAEQAAQLLELAMGDTGDMPDSSEPPAAAADADDQAAAAPQAGATPEPDPANAVILAKDGVHTIPYQRLTDARTEAQQYRDQLQQEQAQRQALEQELAAAKAAAQQRADAGVAPTQADANLAAAEQAMAQGISPDLFGDFSEEAIAKGIATMMDQRVDQRVEAALEKALAPIRQQEQLKAEQEQKAAANAHESAIYGAHPDADSIGESQEFSAWINAKINAQPAYLRESTRAGYQQVLASGSAAEVIDLLSAFKGDTGRTQPAADAKSAAKAAVAGVKPSVPASLSDIPGGTAGPSNRFETLANLAPADMGDVMAGMSAEQIEAFLNRNG
ncbi:MAG TPA: hypothetical protein VIZ86_16720 [Pseudomonas sp.]